MEQTLNGRKILVTRSGPQSGSFSRLLAERGATVLEAPTIEIRPRPIPELDSVARDVFDYDWLFLTSANAAAIVLDRIEALGLAGKQAFPPICTIGPATAQVVERRGWRVELVPSTYQAEGVVADFLDLLGSRMMGVRILLPRASRARNILPKELRSAGALVDVRPVYDTIIPEGGSERIRSLLDEHDPDLVTFTSSSTVHHFIKLAAGHPKVSHLRYGVIGPITAETARSYDLQVVVQPKSFTVPDLAEAIAAFFR